MEGLTCGRRVLQKTCEGEERRELWIEPGKKKLIVGEDCRGPLTEAAFGEPWHRSMVLVDASVWQGLGAHLVDSDAPLCDLMDLLDVLTVPYTYLGVGSGGVVSFRGSSKMNFPQTLDEMAGA